MTRPERNWTADQLAAYCTRKLRREASEAWMMGEAFEMAKSKVAHGGWDKWRQKHHFSASMTERYVKLHKAATLDQVKGMTLTQACHKFGVHINGAGKKKIPHIAEPAWSVEPITADDVGAVLDLPAIVERMSWQLNQSISDSPSDVQIAIRRVLDALQDLQQAVGWSGAFDGVLVA